MDCHDIGECHCVGKEICFGAQHIHNLELLTKREINYGINMQVMATYIDFLRCSLPQLWVILIRILFNVFGGLMLVRCLMSYSTSTSKELCLMVELGLD